MLLSSMNIDIFSQNGYAKGSARAGLLASGVFPSIPAAVLYDAQTYHLTVEFTETDPLHTNIEIDPDFSDRLLQIQSIYFGGISNGAIDEALTLPFIVLNDPHGTPMTLNSAPQAMRQLKEFDQFIKQAEYAQPVHREDLTDEDSSHSILSNVDRKALGFSPRLLRQVQLGIGPQAPAAQPQIQPQAAPAMGQGTAGTVPPPQRPRNKKSDD
jgi:hypothetical protein